MRSLTTGLIRFGEKLIERCSIIWSLKVQLFTTPR